MAKSLEEAFLDALNGNAVLISPRGEIVAANEAWRRFAEENGLSRETSTSHNYFGICEESEGEGAEIAREAARGIRTVLSGERDDFEMDYPCHSPGSDRWFRMRVRRVAAPDGTYGLIVHEDVTSNHVEMVGREQLVESLERMGRLILGSMEADSIVRELSRQVVERQIFRSIMVALVDEGAGTVTVNHALRYDPNIADWGRDRNAEGLVYDLDDSNITAVVARTGMLRTIETPTDSRLDPRMKDHAAKWEGKIAYFVPIRFGDTVAGVMATASPPEQRESILRRIESMQPLLGQVAIALHHAKLLEEKESAVQTSEHSRAMLASVLDFGSQILADLDEETILQRLASRIVDSGYFRSAGIYLVDADRPCLRCVVEIYRMPGMAHTEAVEERTDREYDLDSGDAATLAYRQNETQVIDRWDDPRLDEDPHRTEETWGRKVAYFVPIAHEGRVYAVYATGSEREARDEIERRVAAISPLFAQVAIALHHARVHAESVRTSRRLRAREADLERSEALFRLVFESSPVPMALGAPDRKILKANRAFAAFLGYEAGELEGMIVTEITAPEESEDVLTFDRQLRDGEVSYGVRERTYVRKDGTRAQGELHATTIDGSEGYVVAIVQDLTERKRAEQELVRLNRLRAVAQLAAGVSHNLNNLLMSVVGPAQMLQRMDLDPDALVEVDQILTGGRRAADLVRRLHDSVRTDRSEEVTAVPVNACVEEAITATRPRWKDEPESLGKSIELAVEYGEVPYVAATYHGLESIVINLILNAADAIRADGRIACRTFLEEDTVVLTVRDDGIGMDDDTRSRIFEPFYTTKKNVGTGLGLSTAMASVEGWGGRVSVESVPGEGSCFRVELPVWIRHRPEDDAAATAALTGPTRRGRLLVVDDESDVGDLIHRVLPDHEVVCVGRGELAVQAAGENDFDVALIDQGLPDTGGHDLADRIVDILPDVATVMLTGWTIPEEDHRRAHFDYYLQKPLADLDTLVNTVRLAIADHDARAEAGRRREDR